MTNTAEHTFCPRWNDYREQTEATIGTLTPENDVGDMLKHPDLIAKYIYTGQRPNIRTRIPLHLAMSA